MKHVHLTWYLLVDGTHADPNDVAPDADGLLRHKDGLAVALRDNGNPQTIGRGAVENKSLEAAKIGESEPVPRLADVNREMRLEPKAEPAKKPGYQTRRG